MGRKPGACYHWTIPTDSYIVSDGINRGFFPVSLSFLDKFKQEAYNTVHLGLDFQENNNFELLPFLFDLDDTLAMFTKKFWAQLSYGSLSWGVLPFISDLKSLIDTCRDIQSDLAKSYEKYVGKRVTRRFTYKKYFLSTSKSGSWNQLYEGTVVLQGNIVDFDMPDTAFEASLVLLDELGLNLDLKTVWDVIPFSFVLDYFLPIGDALEALHPRGWFSPRFKFNGTVSFDIEITSTWNRGLTSNVAYAPSNARVYWRDIINDNTLSTRPTVEPEWTCPSWREIFNTYYLSEGIRGLFKGLSKNIRNL